MLETAETRWQHVVERLFDTPQARELAPSPAVWCAFLNWRLSTAGVFRPPLGVAERPVVYARVNHGRWLVDCPFPGCASAQHVSHRDPWWYCARCHNEHVGHAMIPVAFPPEADAIEARLLERRPRPEHRNWEPHETLADLRAQDG